MKRKHAMLIISGLIMVIFLWRYAENRKDLQCYVMQLADRLEYAFTAGYATAEEIRKIVHDDTVADFRGQAWRATLDRIFHDLFMGGNRGKQVVALMENPTDGSSEDTCLGSIEWQIIYDPDYSIHRSYSGSDILTGHQVTTALKALPEEELRHYIVEAYAYTLKSVSSGDGDFVWTGLYRDAGSVSAREWLGGKTVPEYWSAWYVAWQEQWQDLQNKEDD